MPETSKTTKTTGEHGEKDKGHEGEHGEGHEGREHEAGGEKGGETKADPQEIARRANERNGVAKQSTEGLDVPDSIDGFDSDDDVDDKLPKQNTEGYQPFTDTMRRDAAAWQANNPATNHAQAVTSGQAIEMQVYGPGPAELQTVSDASNQAATSSTSAEGIYSLAGLPAGGDGMIRDSNGSVIGYGSSQMANELIAQENAPAQAPVTAAGDNVPVIDNNPAPAGGGGGGSDRSPWRSRFVTGLKIFGGLGFLSGLGFGGYVGGKALGWWGTEPALTGPEVGPITKAQAPRRAGKWDSVTFPAGLDTAQADAEAASPLKLDSFRFFKSPAAAMDPGNQGSETLDVPGGTWCFAVNAAKTDVDLTFTPDGTKDDVPPVVYYKIKNEALIRSVLQSITLTYAPKQPAPTPTVTAPKVADVTINEQIYDQAFSLDLATYLTKGTNEIAFETLELVKDDGTAAAEIGLANGTGTWRARVSMTEAKIEFTPNTNFRGVPQSVKFRIYDTAQAVSNTATLSATFLVPPFVSNDLIGIDDLSAGKSFTFDVLSKAQKGTHDIDTTSLVLIGTIKVEPDEADPVFDPSDKVFGADNTVRGYTRITVPQKGLWEIVDVDGRAQLRFTVGDAGIDDSGIVQYSVADVKGNESPQAKVHIAKDYVILSKAIAGMMDKDDAAFWADFKAKVVDPTDEDVPLEVMLDVVRELLAAAQAAAADQKQTPMDQPNLKNGGAPIQAVRSAWNNSGDKASLFSLTLQNIDYAATGDAVEFQTRSYWNRSRRLQVMRLMISEYFAFLRDMMS